MTNSPQHPNESQLDEILNVLERTLNTPNQFQSNYFYKERARAAIQKLMLEERMSELKRLDGIHESDLHEIIDSRAKQLEKEKRENL